MTPTIVLSPYAATTTARRRWHTARAGAIVRLLTAEGTPAMAIHRGVDAGDYGDDADPEARARGLAMSGAVAATFPRVFVLETDSGSMTEGVRRDLDAWLDAHPGRPTTWAGRWSDLRDRFEAAGLGDVWARLAVRPDVAGEWQPETMTNWPHRAYRSGVIACDVMNAGDGSVLWRAWDADGNEIGRGYEPSDAAGRAAADAALRAAGVTLAGEVTRD